MEIFIIVSYITIVAWILYAIEVYGMASNWKLESWSPVHWITFFSSVVWIGVILALVMRFFLDVWVTKWNAKLKRVTEIAIKKDVQKEKVKEQVTKFKEQVKTEVENDGLNF